MHFTNRGNWAVLLGVLTGCGIWITPEDVDAVRDSDLDGVPAAEDCDDSDPEAQKVEDWFTDLDGDGFGAGSPRALCNPPSDGVREDGDCNDADPTVLPGAPEFCDEIDNDCDGDVDEDPYFFPWYDDVDGDGWGDDATVEDQCVPQPTGVDRGGDCDDTDPAVHPEALETCSGVDEDCDGLIDEDDPDMYGKAIWFADGDDDGYGAGPGTEGCDPPGTGPYSQLDGDCDDTDAAINPGAPELCDGVDNDCDNAVDVLDNDLADGELFYPDTDGDGFGDAFSPVLACTPPPNHSADGGDCDDTDGTVYPRASEVLWPDDTECSDMADNDCDGTQDNNDDDCQDDDVDGVVNGIDALFGYDADGDQLDESLCARVDILSETPWSADNAVPVFQVQSSLFPEDSLDLGNTVTLDAVLLDHWCWDLGALGPGDYKAELVSVIHQDGSAAVSPTNCNTWKRATVADYCQQTTDDLCGSGLPVDSCTLEGRAIFFSWNGSSL